jgi:hypothetical protein
VKAADWIRTAGLLGLVLTGRLEPRVAAQAQGNRIALVGGALLDGTGAMPLRDSVVLIRGDRIERVGSVATLPVPAGYESISTEGLTVMPGLWDLHVHLIYSGHPNPGAWFRHDTEFQSVTIPASARQMLMAGVTSVRDLAAPAAAVLDVKRQVAEAGCRAHYTAGPALAKLAPNQTSSRASFNQVDGAVTPRTRQLLDAGGRGEVFFVERMSPEERAAIGMGARARESGNARATDAEVRLGLQMGIDDFQHRHRQPWRRAPT